MESSEGSITLILQYVISNIESNQASTINLVEMSKNRMMRGQVKAANKDWKRTCNRAGTGRICDNVMMMQELMDALMSEQIRVQLRKRKSDQTRANEY